MAKKKTVGVEQARLLFPELLDQANKGQTTVITKRGKPWAALVSVEQASRSAKRSPSFASLSGTGKGLFGKDPSAYVRRSRGEWDK